MFEANLRLAAIEQVILDEAITMVIDHVPQNAADEVEGRVATFAERSLRVPRRIAQITTSRRLAGMTTLAREVWARVMTDQVMVLALPSETLRLVATSRRATGNDPSTARPSSSSPVKPRRSSMPSTAPWATVGAPGRATGVASTTA